MGRNHSPSPKDDKTRSFSWLYRSILVVCRLLVPNQNLVVGTDKTAFGAFRARPIRISWTVHHAGSELSFSCGSIQRNNTPNARTIAPMIHHAALFLKIAEISSVMPPAPTASFG
jgi:hypothetical protein